MKTKIKYHNAKSAVNINNKKRLTEKLLMVIVFSLLFFVSMPTYAIYVNCTTTIIEEYTTGDYLVTRTCDWLPGGFGGGNWPGGDGNWPGSGGNSGSNSGNAVLCNEINQTSPNTDESPNACTTDPGNANNTDYSDFITANMGSILGDLNTPCTDGCYWSNNFPFVTAEMAQEVISVFARSYYSNFDYIMARNDILDTLMQPCIDRYWENPNIKGANSTFRNCTNSQIAFLYSMTPDTYGSTGQWSAGISIDAPWGISFSFGISEDYQYNNSNWVSNLLELISADRGCHLWLQALEAAGCTSQPDPSQP